MKILIVGCERSGTTVIAKLLSKSTGLKLLNDPKESWYIYPLVKTIGLKGMPLSFILKLWKHPIVKVPGFATILTHLRKIQINQFKVIYLVRDPRDNYAAIKERLNEDLNGLYININFLNLKGKSQCENVSLRWNSYLNSAMRYNDLYGDVLFVKYEDFLENKLNVLDNISKFCGVKFTSSKIINELDKQSNKSWSKNIKGKDRYLNDLTPDEIEVVTRISKENMNIFNYR
ncbi:sulfotransferase family protein [Psychroflexus montanilacus]|uniref:sulfotransferase family protein n=1 Tax=Psychroflexus montanilacus TaxID=2873598 RepID=UPI001CCF5A0A|nr:sulfotransferase [Psychroflexus montanilacus]MBZ9652113.1 sulfotransferase [Psychroflexus montanilacus]